MVDTNENNKRDLKTEDKTNVNKKIKVEQIGEKDAILLAESMPESSSSNNVESTALKDEEKEPEFFTTSMYTDEFNTMLETVLEGESFLFNTNELKVFEQFQSLQGRTQYQVVTATLCNVLRL